LNDNLQYLVESHLLTASFSGLQMTCTLTVQSRDIRADSAGLLAEHINQRLLTLPKSSLKRNQIQFLNIRSRRSPPFLHSLSRFTGKSKLIHTLKKSTTFVAQAHVT
jgi:hypothetical protein